MLVLDRHKRGVRTIVERARCRSTHSADPDLKPLRPPAPEDFYDIINERYERGSILLTSNRPPEEWPELFGNPLLASAGLDRLTHGAHAVIITGSSFRAQGPQRWEEVHIEPSAST